MISVAVVLSVIHLLELDFFFPPKINQYHHIFVPAVEKTHEHNKTTLMYVQTILLEMYVNLGFTIKQMNNCNNQDLYLKPVLYFIFKMIVFFSLCQ